MRSGGVKTFYTTFMVNSNQIMTLFLENTSTAKNLIKNQQIQRENKHKPTTFDQGIFMLCKWIISMLNLLYKLALISKLSSFLIRSGLNDRQKVFYYRTRLPECTMGEQEHYRPLVFLSIYFHPYKFFLASHNRDLRCPQSDMSRVPSYLFPKRCRNCGHDGSSSEDRSVLFGFYYGLR